MIGGESEWLMIDGKDDEREGVKLKNIRKKYFLTKKINYYYYNYRNIN